MKYHCRVVLPKPECEGNWIEVEAETPEQAVQEYHFGLSVFDQGKSWRVEEGGKAHVIRFARIEVEGWGDCVSRVYHYGLWRKGGVKPLIKPTLKDVADAIEWKGDPEELVEEGWELEETMEEAEARRC